MLANDRLLLGLSGQPVALEECNVVIVPPKLKDIGIFGESKFFAGIHILANLSQIVKDTKAQNAGLLDNATDLQVLSLIVSQSEETEQLLKDILNFVCPDYDDIEIGAEIKFIKNGNIVGMLFDRNYADFASMIKFLFISNATLKKEYNPANEAAAEIAEKFRQAAAKRGKGKKEENISIFTNYVSVLSVGMGLDVNIFLEYTPFQLYDSFDRYWAKVGSDFYQKVATTPLMDVSKMEKPEDWTRNLY